MTAGTHAEARFQLTDGLTERRGRKSEMIGGAREAGPLDDGSKRLQFREIRPSHSSSNGRPKSSTKYTYTSEPLVLDQRDGMTVVTSRLTGNFPGSPVELRFFFRLERGKIAFLEIIP